MWGRGNFGRTYIHFLVGILVDWKCSVSSIDGFVIGILPVEKYCAMENKSELDVIIDPLLCRWSRRKKSLTKAKLSCKGRRLEMNEDNYFCSAATDT